MADGYETLETLENRHGRLSATAEAATGGGGRHVYFRIRGSLRSRDLGPGVELKGDGSYVVAPPSQQLKGPYAWNQELPANLADLPDLPHWARGSEEHGSTSPPHGRRRPPRARRNDGLLPAWLPEYVPVGTRHLILRRLAGWLRRADHDEREILSALDAIRDQRFEQPPQDPISNEWLAGLARAMAGKPAGGAGASLYQCWGDASLEWKRRTARRDRKVLLQAILPMALRRGRRRLRLPVRTVAPLAGISIATAGRALTSLVARGALVELRVANRGRAAAYLLNAPPRSSHRDTEHDSGPTPRSYPRTVSLRDRDAFRWRALGWAAEPIYEALSRRKSLSVAELHAATGVPKSTTSRVLPRLEHESLAIRAKHGWRRGKGSLTKAAERHGVLDQYDRERARYRAERLRYRSQAGRRRRQLLHERRVALIKQILAFGEALGFPRVEGLKEGKREWNQRVRKARGRTLQKILCRLKQRRPTGRAVDRQARETTPHRVKL